MRYGLNPPRLVAFDWARTQAGKPYAYGGTGPNSYDCSGLVYATYKRAGFTLPRTTQGMLASGMFGRTGNPKAGELAFFGTGHGTPTIGGFGGKSLRTTHDKAAIRGLGRAADGWHWLG